MFNKTAQFFRNRAPMRIALFLIVDESSEAIRRWRGEGIGNGLAAGATDEQAGGESDQRGCLHAVNLARSQLGALIDKNNVTID